MSHCSRTTNSRLPLRFASPTRLCMWVSFDTGIVLHTKCVTEEP